MAAFPFDIVGFDLDGTLVDSSGDLTAAVNFALADAGRGALSVEQVETMIGGGAKHLLQQVLDVTGGCEADEFRRLYKLMLGYYDAHLSVHTHLFDGAIEALDDLASRGVTLAIVTNKFESFAIRLIADLGLTDRFACLIGGDTLGKGNSKPSPAPIHEMVGRCGGGRAVFVGDSSYDIDAAKAAGIPSVAVAFGFLLQPVESLGADAVIQNYGELIPALARLSAT